MSEGDKVLGLFCFTLGVVFTTLVCFSIISGGAIDKAVSQYDEGVVLVSECEKELPRHLKCQLVLSAEAEEGDMR